jgi:hypothetical protein
MKKTLLAILTGSCVLISHQTQAQSIDYGMIAGFVQSPTAGTDVVGGGFQLLGVTPSSGFNPTGASLADLLSSANMLSVSNSFATIDAANPGQFYQPGLLTFWSTGASIATGTQLYVLASASSSFDAGAPWALLTGSDVGWFSPNPTDPFGYSNIELSFGGNSIIASGFGGPGVGAYFDPAGPGTSVSPGDANLVLVPEPSTYALLSLAGIALGGYAARRRRRA